MLDIAWNIVSFVVALGILITVHEYGHFWVARKNNVKVERFSVGFGTPIWRKVDKQGTEFVLALIPLGGYVKMLDERVDDVNPEDKHRTFNSKNVYQRIAIIAAGPLANFIFAFFAFSLMFLIGIPTIKPIIGEIQPHSLAAQSQLSVNSEIVEVNGNKVRSWQDVNMALVSNIGNDALSITTKNSDSASALTSVIDTKTWKYDQTQEASFTSLGIQPYQPQVHAIIAGLKKGGPAELAGLKKGDELLTINGVDIPDWSYFSVEIKKYADQLVNITVLRKDNVISSVVKPEAINRHDKTVGFIGIAPKVDEWPEEYRRVLEYGPVDALIEGSGKTWNLITLSIDMIGKLITGDVSMKNLSGPISIAQGAGNSASYGLIAFLGFLGLISINLGIINLLPLPVLDGGHLFYYLIELVTGKPVPENIQSIGFKFGTLALLGLMSIALFNDLSRL